MTIAPPIPAYTVREASKYLNQSRDTTYKMLRDGRLRGEIDCTGQLRIPYDELLYQLRRMEEPRMK
jgi:excisionase family DNA binding protein